MWPAGTEMGFQEATTVQICAHSLAARVVVILYFLAHFSIESPPGKGYICGSVDVFIFAAKGEGSPTCPRFAGRQRGRSLRNTHVLNRGGRGVRSPLDGLKSSSGKVSYTDLHKTPG